MRTLHVLLPMGGLGERFAKAGFALPKPLIPVDGQPMFRKALSSFQGWNVPMRYTAVLRRAHEDEFQLATKLKAALPEMEIVLLESLTRGAVETCLAAAPAMQGDDGLVVMDCDLWFRSETYATLVRASLDGRSSLSGGLLTFPADSPRYSYAELGEDNRVVRTAEKQVISPWAIAGAYYFGTERRFLDAARTLMSRPLGPEMREYYLSYLYNDLLESGGEVRAAPTEGYASFGTPEELKAYEAGAPSTTPAR